MSDELLQLAISLSSNAPENISIGIQNEKILHKIMKYYITTNPKNHEIKVGNIYADVVLNNHIYEIQTASFNALRKKLDFLLKDYLVTIVYPVSHRKTIITTSIEGEVISEKKSPKVFTPFSILVEMYKIKSYLKNPNLSFKVIYLDMDEYRQKTKKNHFRQKGYERLKQIPTKFINEYDLKEKDDYLKIFDLYNFPEEFTTLEFQKVFKISSSKVANCLQVLHTIGVIELIGKRGRRNLWKKTSRI